MFMTTNMTTVGDGQLHTITLGRTTLQFNHREVEKRQLIY